MSSKGKIESGKILVKEIFSTKWFSIPVYQRPYVWGTDQVVELLDDLTFAMTENPENPDFEYFFGSFVFQSKAAAPENGQTYLVNDLLDGQQRMATILMLFAAIRDLVGNDKAKSTCQKCIFQDENEFMKIPAQTRLVYVTHPEVTKFINEYIKTKNGTINEDSLRKISNHGKLQSKNSDDISVKSMANAVLVIRKFFRDNPDTDPIKLLHFLLNNVLFIYVSTEDREDAFRLFRVLNDRGVQLRNSDILKATNLAELKTPDEQIKYAKMWEDAESKLGDGGDGFERFLNYVRTILVKDKARHELITEFEQKIYIPKKLENGQKALSKGQETFELIERYLNIYHTLLDDKTSFFWSQPQSYEFDNLIRVMLKGLKGTDWMSPLLRYYEKFEHDKILDFLKLLDIKYSADWIGRSSPTERIMAMVNIIKVIDAAENVNDVFNSKFDPKCFSIDKESFIREIEGPVYGKGFARYLLLKLDYFYGDHQMPMNVERLSVEHILPQNPAEDSSWVKDFSSEERTEWTHKIGNLVLITGHKDSSLGRHDYKEKKKIHFEKNINSIPNSLRVLNQYGCWTPKELEDNHHEVLNEIYRHYSIPTTKYV